MPDLLIVGGGPAGLATAIFAARSGLSSVVVEKRILPLDKPCGEGIMPSGVALLEKMGVAVAHASFSGIRYLDRAVVAEARFMGPVGWGVRRTALVESMVQRALELGVDVRFGARWTEWRVLPDRVELRSDRGDFEGKYLIAADGLHSTIRKQARLERPARGPKRFALRTHFRVRPWSDCVEVHWTDGAEAYVTPVASDQLGVALLSHRAPVGFEEGLVQFPELRERLAGAAATSGTRGAGPLRQRVHCRCRGRLALVGDAAGYLDAITGEGLSLAFRTAQALIASVTEQGDLEGYEAAYRRLSRMYYRMTGLLLSVSRRPRLRRRVVAALATRPELFESLLAISMGQKKARSVGLGGIVGLVGSILSHRGGTSRGFPGWASDRGV